MTTTLLCPLLLSADHDADCPICLNDEAVVFFANHAGWSYSPATETASEGRWRSARALARAESWAKAEDIDFDWYDDWMVDHAKEYDCYSGDAGPATCEVCVAKKGDEVLASLGCIDDASPEYRRVVEAELADEALHDVMEALEGRRMQMLVDFA
jgi:hypothetical protein